ncbi:hypothetical protein [Motiliproteus sp. MSK22-1]|uniref:hypothetical protein n=1 Tax=Motiliproteus sp. MSK22-1 TaxID=1897630 RepID=UPI0013013132|nr:hypothetical protein [Motiliproteus sp. MSK22-1]
MSLRYQQLISRLMSRYPNLTRRLIHAGFNLGSCIVQAISLNRKNEESGGVEVMGLRFFNPVGVAAGFDRHGRIGRRFGSLGFGYVEIGTLTPKPEPGHNKGVSILSSFPDAAGLKHSTIMGINIGKNKSTALEQSLDDFLLCLRAAWNKADYVALNMTARENAALLTDSNQELLWHFLTGIKQEQKILSRCSGRYVPIVAKIKFDLNSEKLPRVVKLLKQLHFDGVIATTEDKNQQQSVAELINRLDQFLEGQLVVISVGGILSQKDIQQRQRSGAALVQIHNGLIYEGPEIVKGLRHMARL